MSNKTFPHTRTLGNLNKGGDGGLGAITGGISGGLSGGGDIGSGIKDTLKGLKGGLSDFGRLSTSILRVLLRVSCHAIEQCFEHSVVMWWSQSIL